MDYDNKPDFMYCAREYGGCKYNSDLIAYTDVRQQDGDIYKVTGIDCYGKQYYIEHPSKIHEDGDFCCDDNNFIKIEAL